MYVCNRQKNRQKNGVIYCKISEICNEFND